jgi:hypothetical protein
MKSRKPRSDSKLKNLPEDVQERIAGWCQEDGLQSACSRCAAELQPPVQTNPTSLGEFYAWWRLQRTFRQADSFAREAEEMLKEEFPDATPEKIAAAGQLVFTMQATNAGDADTFKELEYLRVRKEEAQHNARIAELKIQQKDKQIAQKEKDIALATRRVEMLEANAAKAKEQLEAVKAKGGLTPETLAAIEQAAAML